MDEEKMKGILLSLIGESGGEVQRVLGGYVGTHLDAYKRDIESRVGEMQGKSVVSEEWQQRIRSMDDDISSIKGLYEKHQAECKQEISQIEEILRVKVQEVQTLLQQRDADQAERKKEQDETTKKLI